MKTAAGAARFVRRTEVLVYGLAVGLHHGMNGGKGAQSAVQTQREHQNESREMPIHPKKPTSREPIAANRALGYVRR